MRVADTVTVSWTDGSLSSSIVTGCCWPAATVTVVVTGANPSLTTVSSTEPGSTSIRTSPRGSVTYVFPATTISAPATGAPPAVTVQTIAD